MIKGFTVYAIHLAHVSLFFVEELLNEVTSPYLVLVRIPIDFLLLVNLQNSAFEYLQLPLALAEGYKRV